jgi:hypothetical protein
MIHGDSTAEEHGIAIHLPVQAKIKPLPEVSNGHIAIR